MKATSQKTLIMSEEEMRAFRELWTIPGLGKYIPLSLIGPLHGLKTRINKELERESGSTL